MPSAYRVTAAEKAVGDMPAIYGELSEEAHAGWVRSAREYTVTITAILEVMGQRMLRQWETGQGWPFSETDTAQVEELIAEIRALAASRHRQRYDR